jgi:hypothetical protein
MVQPHFNETLGGGVEFPSTPQNPIINPGYVLKLRDELKLEYRGFQTRLKELEAIRYIEDPVRLGVSERPTGLEVRTGLSSDLVEKVKAALSTNMPIVHIKNTREGVKGADNAAKRQQFWQEWVKSLVRPIPIIPEIIDAQAGLGVGIPKIVYYPWTDIPKKDKEESDKDYLGRVKAYKNVEGPPFKVLTVHPMTFMFRRGPGNSIAESIEESLKPKMSVYQTYGLGDGETGDKNLRAITMPTLEGVPISELRPLPLGLSSTNLLQVTEYTNPKVRQVYIEDRLVYEQEDPDVAYFPAIGRNTSSKDPDKWGLSVADILRHIEPVADRTLTRMAEASDLLVRKRMAVELPDGSTDYMENPQGIGEDNDPKPRSFEFSPNKARALPPGAKLADPFAGAENVYGAMPFVSLIMQLASDHGVSPIFKGMGAAGSSGYHDTSLYMMARSQFNYMIENLQFCLSSLIQQAERWIVHKCKREVVINGLTLSPKDIVDYPATFEVEIKPYLPQNLMAMGTFWDQMWTKGHATRRQVRVNGMEDEDPERTGRERMLEDLQDMLKPILLQDVLRTTGISPAPEQVPPTTILGPDGQPIGGENPQAGQMPSEQGQQDQGGAAKSLVPLLETGRGKQPPIDPGTLPQNGA